MTGEPNTAMTPGDTRAEPTSAAGRDVEGLAPGSPAAVDRGCCCSVLANASYRVGVELFPLVDPDCPMHPNPPGRHTD